MTILEGNMVCIYDPFTGIASCTGIPPGGVVLVTTNPVDMASALMSIDQKLRSEGIPAKRIVAVEEMTYTDRYVRGITSEDMKILKNLLNLPAVQY